MARPRELPAELLLKQITHTGPGAPDLRGKLLLAAELRERFPEMATQLEPFFLEQIQQLTAGLNAARKTQSELAALLARQTQPPYFLATFLRTVATPAGPQAIVVHGSQSRSVGFADGVDGQNLSKGEQVFLNYELNLLVGNVPDFLPGCGELAAFDRSLGDGRVVLRIRDEDLVLEPAASLQHADLAPGDLVRWDKQTWLAYERIERPDAKRFFLDELPNGSISQIGGQREAFQQLLDALTIKLIDSQKAAAYGLADGGKTILMHGPPGCGKTLRARVAVAEVARISGRRCRFAVVNAAEWEDPYVGVTQQNIRQCFTSLREAASQDGLAVLFIDEIEAVGRERGIQMNLHGDKFLAALLCELDGFRDRTGVAIIAATNRRDLLDPALLERLTDTEISVPRPDLKAARGIFAVHMREEYPYSPNGQAAAGTRQCLIETAVSRLYAPNAENTVCTLRFRDGKTRTVGARELMSGRLIAQICHAARQAAFLRDHRRGIPGLTVADMEDAVAATIGRLSTTLSRLNAHAYLSDLPQDVDVVAVEPITRRIPQPLRFVNPN